MGKKIVSKVGRNPFQKPSQRPQNKDQTKGKSSKLFELRARARKPIVTPDAKSDSRATCLTQSLIDFSVEAIVIGAKTFYFSYALIQIISGQRAGLR